MRNKFYIIFLTFGFEPYHRVCVVLQGRKLILIKLTFFNIIKGDNIIGFKIGDNGLNSILFSQIDNNGRTACQISKNIADLQLVQGKIPAVHFCISFLQQAHPYLIASA